MGKQKAVNGSERQAISSSKGGKVGQVSDEVRFPTVGGAKVPRRLNAPEVLLEDQIVLFRNFLTVAECAALRGMFGSDIDKPDGDTLVMQPSPAAKRGEAQRTNYRYATVSPTFAQQLFQQTGLANAVADWPSMFAPRLQAKAKGLSSNIRIYRYDPGAIFAPHYDDHSIDPHHGPAWGQTEWTLLVYLTGDPDVQGGQTVFYKGHVRPKEGIASDKAIVAPLIPGAALLHRHGKVCMLHEALPPSKGTKWVLRSDLIFGV